MSYARRWLAKTVSETCRFWTPPRIITTIAAPIIIGIVWAIYKPWLGWTAVMQSAIVSIVGFFALWGLVFFVNLLLAPGKLYAEQQQRSKVLAGQIEQLQTQLKTSPEEESWSRYLEEKLADWSSDELGLLAWLYRTGETEYARFPASGISPSIINQVLNKDPARQIIKDKQLSADGQRAYFVNPELKKALLEYLHNRGMV